MTVLKVGPENQLKNANNFARKLAQQQRLEHQDFKVANREIGCGRALGGENVAMISGSGDIARTCVYQWIDSRGHLESIVRDWFLEVVVGFAFDRNGAVYCVQTFGVTDDRNGSPSDRGCAAVGRSPSPGSINASTPEAAPQKAPAQESDDPSPPDTENGTSGSDVGRSACICVRHGRRYREPLIAETNNVCLPKVRRRDQAPPCKQQCCDYCKMNRLARECRNGAVRGMCRKL